MKNKLSNEIQKLFNLKKKKNKKIKNKNNI